MRRTQSSAARGSRRALTSRRHESTATFVDVVGELRLESDLRKREK